MTEAGAPWPTVGAGVGGCPPEAGTGLYLRYAPTKPPCGVLSASR